MKGCLEKLSNFFQPPRILYKDIVKKALLEDIDHGDITTTLLVPPEKKGSAKIIAKEEGIASGFFIAEEVFKQIDEKIKFSTFFNEGQSFKSGDVLIHLEGKLRSILLGERVALNFIQRLCGISTLTKRAIEEIKDLPVHLVCTRKTTPGLRLLEKYAVRIGGALNHRFNLSDGILIKDNHIEACGSITKAIKRAQKLAPHTLKIEVEVSDIDGVNEAIDAGVDAILLDNMDFYTLKQAVKIVKKKKPMVLLEVSGGVTLENIRDFALTGVDIISSGALTHSYKSIDLSLKVYL